eukprot:1576956-Lingulodinium_polyedra.AAC.1
MADALLVKRNALLVLDLVVDVVEGDENLGVKKRNVLNLDIVDGVGGLDVERRLGNAGAEMDLAR